MGIAETESTQLSRSSRRPAVLIAGVISGWITIVIRIINGLIGSPAKLIGTTGARAATTAHKTGQTDSQVLHLYEVGNVIAIILSLLLLAAIVTSLVFSLRAAKWARVLATVLLALIFVIFAINTIAEGVPGGPLGLTLDLIEIVLLLFSVVSLWLPQSRRYFRRFAEGSN